MLIIQNTLVSENLAEIKFACNCNLCRGQCCVDGDAGAPLKDTEIDLISAQIDKIKPYMSPEGIAVIKTNEIFAYDIEGVKGTPLINGKECAFVVYKKGITYCSIEMAFNDKKISLQKPESCHLYPVRITDYTDFVAVNYHEWAICKSAVKMGSENNIYLYQFLKTPLINKFGEEWYTELVMLAEHMRIKNR
ncbi:MAG: DUF3109 family protein [Bacteroidota bacterium]